MEKKSKCFEDLIVWQKAHKFVLNIYKETANLPKSEIFGITSQIRRSSVSIAANIVEGFKKKTYLDKAKYYNIAQGSLEETKYYLILIKDLNYFDSDYLIEDIDEISRILESYIKSVRELISKN